MAQMGHFYIVLLLFLPVPLYLFYPLLFTSFTRVRAELRGLLQNNTYSQLMALRLLYLVVLPSASSITIWVCPHVNRKVARQPQHESLVNSDPWTTEFMGRLI